MASKTLVVCFSRGGTTMRVAEHLAKMLGADLDRIEENGSRLGLGGYMRSAIEAMTKGLPSIRTRRDPRDYDLVVIGTPVWVGTISSPVRAYLFQHARDFRKVGFFAVMGGRGGEDVVREMQFASGVSSAPTCVLTERDVEHDRFRPRVESFVRSLVALLPTAPEVRAY